MKKILPIIIFIVVVFFVFKIVTGFLGLFGFIHETSVLAETKCNTGTMQVIEKTEKGFLGMPSPERYIVYNDNNGKKSVRIDERTPLLIAGKSNKSEVRIDVLDQTVPKPGTKFKKGFTDIYMLPNEVDEHTYEQIVNCSQKNLQTLKQAIPTIRSFIYANHNPFEDDYFCADNRIVSVEAIDDRDSSKEYDFLVTDGNVGGWGAHGLVGYIKNKSFIFPSWQSNEANLTDLESLETCKDKIGKGFSEDYKLPNKDQFSQN